MSYESGEKADALYDLAQRVGLEMPDDWIGSRVSPDKDGRYDTFLHSLDHDAKISLSLGWRKSEQNRVTFSARLPHPHSTRDVEEYKRLTMTFAVDRDPKAIASALVRAMLPQLFKATAKINARIAEEQAYEESKRAKYARLGRAFHDARMSTTGGDTMYFSGGELQVYSSDVSFRRLSVSLEVAEKIGQLMMKEAQKKARKVR